MLRMKAQSPHMKRFADAAALDTSTETIEQYLARGGRITTCPARPAHADSAYMPSIQVDGYELPLGTGGDEYLPNYVRDITTYDDAQQERLSYEADGAAALVRADVASYARPLTRAYTHAQVLAHREDADIMEEW